MKLGDFAEAGERALQEAVARGQPESLSLDFKADNPGSEALFSKGHLTKQGRKTLGKAASAFANSAGGLLVLGVDCRMEDGVDQAVELVPLEDIDKAYSSVNAALGELLQPRHEGLRVLKISSEEVAGRGYLIIEVPRSERRPHMSQADRHYYKRSGSSSFAMEHYDIEDAFRRQTAPILTLSWRMEPALTNPVKSKLRVHLMVTNEGNSTAKFVRLTFVGNVPGNIPITLDELSPGITPSVPERLIVTPPSDFVVHPQERVKLAALYVVMEKGRYGGQITINGEPWDKAIFNHAYELTAENMLPQPGWMTLRAEDFRPFVAALDDAEDD